MTLSELETRRNTSMGPTYHLMYDEPVHIVKGDGVWLFDSKGKKFLDCYNNVAAVGHCHPEVVEALCAQANTLNTHTRYLHEKVVEFSENLTARFDKELSVCILVCTGTEANDLAVQLARFATGNHACIVSEHSYHGNSTLVQQLSTSERYVRDVRPDWLGVVEPPNTYRGPVREHEEHAGARYAEFVRDEIKALAGRGHKLAAMMVDSIWDSNGTLVAPPDYLERCLELVHDAGGLLIADEVQAGYCRTGRHWWGYENYGIRPDIVTLGKSMGNGHPLAAVITTPEIARRFAEKSHYFNTTAGNPVSAAAGNAVLNVIDKQGLLENVEKVGNYLKAGLDLLHERHAIIGNVQGRGLFWGLDMVKDRESREPMTETDLKRMITLIKNSGCLVGSTGRYENVVKIRPPLVFSEHDADLLLGTLDEVLRNFRVS